MDECADRRIDGRWSDRCMGTWIYRRMGEQVDE